MHIERGKVKEIRGTQVLIETDPENMCLCCPAKDNCIAAEDQKMRILLIENTINAQKGDLVTFTIEEKGVILSSFLLYALPVILLLTGVILGNRIDFIPIQDAELRSGFLGAVGLAVSFVIIKIVSRFTAKSKIFRPLLLEVVAEESL